MFTIASGSVDLDEELKYSGIMKLFHASRKASRPTVTIEGLTTGTRILNKAWRLLQPSTMAASSMSLGIASNALRMMNVLIGSWNRVMTRPTPSRLSFRPICLYQTISGISSEAYGTIRMDKVTMKPRLRPG